MSCLRFATTRSLIAVFIAIGANSCGNSDKPAGPGAGSEKGPCFGNGTCNAGLTCLSNLCVSAADASTGTGGNRGTGGSSSQNVGGGNNPTGGSSTSGTAVTQGGFHISWKLAGATGTTMSCTDFPGQAGISVIATPVGSTSAVTGSYPCADGAGDLLNLQPGAYNLSVSLVDSNGLALTQTAATPATAALTNCAKVVTGNCVSNITVTLTAN